MTLRQFGRVLAKQWKVVLLCFLVVTLGTYAKTKLTHPTYQSSALVEVSVGSGSTDLNDLLANNQLVQTEATLATTASVLSEVASHYPGMTAEQLATVVSATPKTNAFIFEISVQDRDPVKAASIANDIAHTLINQQNQAQLHSVRYGKGSPSDFLFLVQEAQPGAKPVQPNTTLNTGLGAAAGLLIGILLALLIEQLDTRVRTRQEFAEIIDSPILASIAYTKGSKGLLKPDGQGSNAEAYRTLRAQLSFLEVDAPLRSILVTSPVTQEGKSTVAAQMALSFANIGRKTLLIDANPYHPMLYKLFGLAPDKLGLSNAILAFARSAVSSSGAPTQVSLAPYMHAVGIPNLLIMPSGPIAPNPSELLASKAMEHLIEALMQSEVDLMIFDTSSLLELSDASTLGSIVDGTVLVVDMTKANKKHLKATKTLLVQMKARVLGYVLNKQSLERKQRSGPTRATVAASPTKNRRSNSTTVISVPLVPSNDTQSMAETPGTSSGRGSANGRIE